MNAFIPPLGKVVSYTISGSGSPELIEPPATLADEVKEVHKRRTFVRIQCGGSVEIAFRDPASPDFDSAEWIQASGAADNLMQWDLYYTGPIWMRTGDDVYITEGY